MPSGRRCCLFVVLLAPLFGHMSSIRLRRPLGRRLSRRLAPMTPPSSSTDSKGPADLERILAILRRRAGLIARLPRRSRPPLRSASRCSSRSSTRRRHRCCSAIRASPKTSSAPPRPRPTRVPTREAATNAKLVGLKVVAAADGEAAEGAVGGRGREHGERLLRRGSRTRLGDAPPAPSRRRQSGSRTTSLASSSPSGPVRTNRGCWGQSGSRNREFARLSPAQRAGVRGESLSRAAEKLGVLASLQTGNAELVQPAELPTSPSSPKPVRNGILGGVLGLLLGIGLAFLLERLNRRLRDPEEAREAFGSAGAGDGAGEQGDHGVERGDGRGRASLHGERGFPNVGGIAALLQRRSTTCDRCWSPLMPPGWARARWPGTWRGLRQAPRRW